MILTSSVKFCIYFSKLKKVKRKINQKKKNVIYKTDPLLGINYMCSMASYMLVISS